MHQKRLRLATILALGLVLPAADARAQSLEQRADPGFLADAVAYSRAHAATECVTPLVIESSAAVGEPRCEVLELAPLEGPGTGWYAARYLRSGIVEWSEPGDSVQWDELVLFRAKAGGETLLPVWSLRTQRDYEFVQGVRARLRPEGLLVEVLTCLNGTGGCARSYMLASDARLENVDLPFVAALRARLDAGRTLHKGMTLELETLRGTWPVATPGDPNCCPSESFEYTVALEGTRLVLRSATLRPDPAAAPRRQGTVVAVFAHPDDERIVGPLLARLAREGHAVHLVIATDGRLGVTDHAGIPAGDSLATVRTGEARCAARALGIGPPILVGLEDAGLASFSALQRLREEVRRVFRELRPDAVLTFGPEGGTGHPDHRLTGIVVTEVVQAGGDGVPDALYYASLPAERMESAPAARPQVTPMPAALLTVTAPFEPEDFEAGRRAFACHASQYTPEQQAAINAYLAHGMQGAVHLRPWNGAGPGARRTELFD